MLNVISRRVERCAPIRYEPKISFALADLLLAAVAGGLAAAISVYGSQFFDPAIYQEQGFDIWFQADPPRAFRAMTEPGSTWHYRTSVHPLFSLLTSLPMRALTALGVEPLQAGRGMMAACGFFAAAFLLLALRGLGLPRAVGAAFTGVFLASAAYVHWFSLIETYAPASLAMSFALFVLTSVTSGCRCAWLAASVATLAVTVTNWSLALASALFRLELRRAIATSVAALVLVAALAVVQKFVYPHSRIFFMPGSVAKEVRQTQIYRQAKGSGRWTPLANIWSVAVTSAVAPAAEEVETRGARERTRGIVSNQRSPLLTLTASGWIALGSWLVLLAAGACGGWADRERRAVFAAIVLFLLGQFALHTVYGEVTFLYAANFFPVLVVFTAFGWFSHLRAAVAVAALVFVVCGAASNFGQFQAATQLANAIARRP